MYSTKYDKPTKKTSTVRRRYSTTRNQPGVPTDNQSDLECARAPDTQSQESMRILKN